MPAEREHVKRVRHVVRRECLPEQVAVLDRDGVILDRVPYQERWGRCRD